MNFDELMDIVIARVGLCPDFSDAVAMCCRKNLWWFVIPKKFEWLLFAETEHVSWKGVQSE